MSTSIQSLAMIAKSDVCGDLVLGSMSADCLLDTKLAEQLAEGAMSCYASYCTYDFHEGT